MDLAAKIRELSIIAEEDAIAEALNVPLELVSGLLMSEIQPEALNNYNPLQNEIIVVERIKDSQVIAQLCFLLSIKENNPISFARRFLGFLAWLKSFLPDLASYPGSLKHKEGRVKKI